MAIEEQERFVIRAKLLECLASEKVPLVRNKIGDAVAEVARLYTTEGKTTRCNGHLYVVPNW